VVPLMLIKIFRLVPLKFAIAVMFTIQS